MEKSVGKAIQHTYTLLPSPTISQNPMEVYNAMMFLGLIRFDNLAVNISKHSFPYFKQMNIL